MIKNAKNCLRGCKMISAWDFCLFVVALSLGTFATRALAFVLFAKRIPRIIIYLGRVAPSAGMGILLVYCYKNLSLDTLPLNEIIATLAVVVIYLCVRIEFIAIAFGTALFMFLTQSGILSKVAFISV